MSNPKRIGVLFACIFKKGTLSEKLQETTTWEHKNGKWKADRNVARKLQQILIQKNIYPVKFYTQKGIFKKDILTNLYNEDKEDKENTKNFFVAFNHKEQEHFGQVIKIEKKNGTITKLRIRVKKLAKDAETYFKFWTEMRLKLQKKMKKVKEEKKGSWKNVIFNLQEAIRKPPDNPLEWIVEKIITLQGKKLSELRRLFIEDKENRLNPYTSEVKINSTYEKEFVQNLNEDLVRYGYVALKTDASNELEKEIKPRKIYEIYPVQDIDYQKVKKKAIGKWERFKAIAETDMKALFETFKEEERKRTDEAWENNLKVETTKEKIRKDNREKELEAEKVKNEERKRKRRLKLLEQQALDNNNNVFSQGGSSSSSGINSRKQRKLLLKKRNLNNFNRMRLLRNEEAKDRVLRDTVKEFPEDDNSSLYAQRLYENQKSRFYIFLFNFEKSQLGFFGNEFLRKDMTEEEAKKLKQRQEDLLLKIENTRRFLIRKEKADMVRQDILKSTLQYYINGTPQASKIQKIPLLKVGDKVKFGLNESIPVESLQVGKIIRVPTPLSDFYIIEKDKIETKVLGKNIFYKLLFERKIKRVNTQNYTKKDKQMQKKLYGHLLNDKVVTHDVEEKYMNIKFHLQDDYDTREDYMVKVESRFVAWDDVIAFYRPYYGTVNEYLENNKVSVCYDEGEFGIRNVCDTIPEKYVLQDDRQGRTIDHLELSKIRELLRTDQVSPLQDGEDTLLVALPRYNRNLSGNVVQCYRVGQLRRAVKFLNNGKELMIGPDVQIYQREKVIENHEKFRQVYIQVYKARVDSSIDEYKILFQLYTTLNTIKKRVEKMLRQRVEKIPDRMEELKKITLTKEQSIPKMAWIGDGKFTGRSDCIYYWQYTIKNFILPEGNVEFKASFYKLIEKKATTDPDRDLVGAYNDIDIFFYEIFTVLGPGVSNHENKVNDLSLRINNFVREFNSRYNRNNN